MEKVILIGIHHYDPKGEERLQKALESFDYDLLASEGVEDWSKYFELRKEAFQEAKEKLNVLPEERRKEALESLKGKNSNTSLTGYETDIIESVERPVLYLDDEEYIEFSVKLYRKVINAAAKRLVSIFQEVDEGDEDKLSREDGIDTITEGYFEVFSVLHPQIMYDISLERGKDFDLRKTMKKGLKKYLETEDEERREEVIEEIVDSVEDAEGVKENIKESVRNLSGENTSRDKKWKEKIDEYFIDNPDSTILSVVGVGHITSKPESFYSLLKQDYDVERYGLDEMDRDPSFQ